MEKTYDYSSLPDSIPVADAEQALKLLAEFKQETELTKRDKAKAAALKEIALAEITKKYDFYEKLFTAVFAERRTVAEEFFKVIDQGIREKNNDLVLAGLSSLSGMISSNPLSHLKKGVFPR
jgi:hypothetical protein